jgi:hypothetical protein
MKKRSYVLNVMNIPEIRLRRLTGVFHSKMESAQLVMTHMFRKTGVSLNQLQIHFARSVMLPGASQEVLISLPWLKIWTVHHAIPDMDRIIRVRWVLLAIHLL